mmetsp:Transcript_50426/g.114455  ORF Transcript_50426/g.114455 Transcript_50426/m.114455 type:complete len:232 (-) Transcript_50426:344-1039(-)
MLQLRRLCRLRRAVDTHGRLNEHRPPGRWRYRGPGRGRKWQRHEGPPGAHLDLKTRRCQSAGPAPGSAAGPAAGASALAPRGVRTGGPTTPGAGLSPGRGRTRRARRRACRNGPGVQRPGVQPSVHPRRPRRGPARRRFCGSAPDSRPDHRSAKLSSKLIGPSRRGPRRPFLRGKLRRRGGGLSSLVALLEEIADLAGKVGSGLCGASEDPGGERPRLTTRASFGRVTFVQ